MSASELDVVTRFRSRARIHCPAVRIVAVPNAAKRGQKALNSLRREGAAFGFPDIMALWPRDAEGRGGVAFIEFKNSDGGRLSPNQAEWQGRLRAMGFPATVSSDPDQALGWLREQGAPFLDERQAIDA